jgi:hypothetical protein
MTLSEHLRQQWRLRCECINPTVPPDLPEWQRSLVDCAAWRTNAMETAGTVDLEIDELIRTLRELGIAEVRPGRSYPQKVPITAHAKMVSLYQSGESLAAIGKRYGVSRRAGPTDTGKIRCWSWRTKKKDR